MPIIGSFQTPTDLNTPTDIQQEITNTKRSFEAEVSKIRANTNLSADGKRILIAKAFLPAREEVARLQRKESDEYEHAVQTLERKLFGLSAHPNASDIISYRDAQDRAEAISHADEGKDGARKLLKRAGLSNDDHLARAVILTAISRGWRDVVGEFVASNADQADTVDRYLTLRRFNPSESMLAYYTYKFEPPSEIGAMPLERVQRLADGNIDA